MTKKISGVSFPSEESRRPALLAAGVLAVVQKDDSLKDQLSEFAQEDTSNLLLLSQHYQIQPGPSMFYDLALALARDLYPAPKKPGRKSKWDEWSGSVLVVEIERLVKPNVRAYGVNWAAKQLATRDLWKSFLDGKENEAVLRCAYYEFKDHPRSNDMRDKFKSCERFGQISEWEKLSKNFVRKRNLN